MFKHGTAFTYMYIQKVNNSDTTMYSIVMSPITKIWQAKLKKLSTVQNYRTLTDGHVVGNDIASMQTWQTNYSYCTGMCTCVYYFLIL